MTKELLEDLQKMCDGYHVSDEEIEMGDDEEYYTIDGIDVNGNLPLTRYHPNRAPNSESTTSVNFLRDYISNGRWVWV